MIRSNTKSRPGLVALISFLFHFFFLAFLVEVVQVMMQSMLPKIVALQAWYYIYKGYDLNPEHCTCVLEGAILVAAARRNRLPIYSNKQKLVR